MHKKAMPLGPLMLDLAATEVSATEESKLLHPQAGGVILFTRNFASGLQLGELTAHIHELRSPALLIAVDHEGGRVQRFREGFTRIPPMRELGNVWDAHPGRARQLAEQAGFVLAAELRAHGVDFSFAPVLDLDYGASGVIGDRAFHRKPEVVAELAHNLVAGMRRGGMGAVGKHFPGHGHVRADSHLEVPVDERDFADIMDSDLIPFVKMTGFGLAGIMPAHVIYPKVDKMPAGFSKIWLKDILRGRIGFDGALFSDDISMEGASVAGGAVERARAALHAGCDFVLACNCPDKTEALCSGLDWDMPALSLARLARIRGQPHAPSMVQLREDGNYVKAVRAVAEIGIKSGDLGLN